MDDFELRFENGNSIHYTRLGTNARDIQPAPIRRFNAGENYYSFDTDTVFTTSMDGNWTIEVCSDTSFDESETRPAKRKNSKHRESFAEKLRRKFGETAEPEKELFDEHGGDLDKFLEEFSEYKEQK